MPEATRVYSKKNPVPAKSPIEALGLSRRTMNCLKSREGMTTVGDVVAMTREKLLRLEGFGPKCLEDVQHQLEKHGRCLCESPPPRAFLTFPTRR
jgi:DNA-directed RNA polymerase alpha subunit